MNILNITKSNNKVQLTPVQFSFLASSTLQPEDEQGCLAYISPLAIGVTTCGTKIVGDNVFPQQDKTKTKILEYSNQPMVEVHAQINQQPVIALANKHLMNELRMFDFCETKTVHHQVPKAGVPTHTINIDNITSYTEYTNCSHIKLLLNNQDIYIAHTRK